MRRSARFDMVCSKIEGASTGGCGHPPLRRSKSDMRKYDRASSGGLRAARPTQKGKDVVPNPKSCVGREAHIAPRIPDAESMVSAAGRRGRRPLQGCTAPTLNCRGRCPRRSAPAAAGFLIVPIGTPHFLLLHYYLLPRHSASSGRSMTAPTAWYVLYCIMPCAYRAKMVATWARVAWPWGAR